MPPDEPNGEEELEELPDDYDTPFSVAYEAKDAIAGPDGEWYMTDKLGATHPATDSGMQLEELYDEGLSGAAEARTRKLPLNLQQEQIPGSARDRARTAPE